MKSPFHYALVLLGTYLSLVLLALLFSLSIERPSLWLVLDDWIVAEPIMAADSLLPLAPVMPVAMDPRIEVPLPDFSSLDVTERKQAFLDFLLPLVLAENIRIQQKRQRILTLQDSPTEADVRWLLQLQEQYRITGDEPDIGQLLHRVDLIPPSLALAQAANESGWGTSRFAQEGNNLFGQWCFSAGCGLVPAGRPTGARYEVKLFARPEQSVEDYMLNLNRHNAYRQLRSLRHQQRVEHDVLNGIELARGLQSYSARGMAYVRELQQMIRSNGFDQFDEVLPLLTPASPAG